MIPISKFDALSNAIQENTSYKLNAKGIKMIQQYHDLIEKLETAISPVISILVKDKIKTCKQAAIQIISSINSNKEGNETFDVMARLDTLTNGGKTYIDGSTITFNPNDIILQYLEKS
ncbi:MAG: hypothetical protein PHS54_00210 [Clostridia bacterium]|nr:hypothetical protein [Clostridia bacterium]